MMFCVFFFCSARPVASLNAYKLGSLQHAVHFVRYNVTSVLMGPSLVASFPAQLVEALLLGSG
mgnify:CR=1 FL=1